MDGAFFEVVPCLIQSPIAPASQPAHAFHLIRPSCGSSPMAADRATAAGSFSSSRRCACSGWDMMDRIAALRSARGLGTTKANPEVPVAFENLPCLSNLRGENLEDYPLRKAPCPLPTSSTTT